MNKPIDVLLVYPLPTRDSPATLVPLSILHPGAWFKAQGLRVAYFDERYDTAEAFRDLVRESRMVAVSAMTGYQALAAASLLEMAKQIDPSVECAVGGPHARILPEQVLAEPFVDKIFPEAAYGEDLFPYDGQTRPLYARSEVMYMTSFGCPYGCRYCAQRRAWQPRSIDVIDRELSLIHEGTGFSNVSFCDPNISHFMHVEQGNKLRIDAVARMRQIGKTVRRLGATYDCSMRVPNVCDDMVEALVEGNCKTLFLGCESGSERVLRRVAMKGHGVEEIRKAVLHLRGSGISTLYSFMAFMPGETPEDLWQTMDLIDWIGQTDPAARVSIYSFTPYPGTPMYDDAVSGKFGAPYVPPRTMREWGERRLMNAPIYWIAGLNFRPDATGRNFPGDDYALIAPYVDLARKKWANRDVFDFPCDEVEAVILNQQEKQRMVRQGARVHSA